MFHPEDSSEFVEHTDCEQCGSSDGNSLFTDGHQYCFVCEHYVHPPRDPSDLPARRTSKMTDTKMLPRDEVEYRRIGPRAISQETAEKFRYGYGSLSGSKVHVATYCDEEGHAVAQKLRFPDKDFPWLGDKKAAAPLYGMWLWPNSGKRVVITEGEIDALSVSQVQSNKWPVVSLKNGAKAAERDVSKAIRWLEGYDEIVLFFDNDTEGRAAVGKVAHMFSPGKVKVAYAPEGYKDANDLLVKGKSDLVMRCIWDAKAYRPDGMLSVADVKERAKKPVEWGVDWPWPTLTAATYGRRRKRIYMFGGGVGSGKTDLFTQIIAQTIDTLGEACATFYLEQPVEETLSRIAGKTACKLFHVPDAGWTQEQLDLAIDGIPDDMLDLYDNFGSTEWDLIKAHVRWLVVSKGVRHMFLDHLTALISHAQDERRALDMIMEEMAALANELDFTWYVVSHLTTPDGKPHEEGGRVMEKHFTGSRAIARWSHFMFGLERDKQSDDPTTFRILKDRDTGRSSGVTFGLAYDRDTGILSECPIPVKDEFPDEDNGGDF